MKTRNICSLSARFSTDNLIFSFLGAAWWRALVEQCEGAEVISVSEMESNENVWADWLAQDNEYAVGDRRTMEAGGGKYLNFVAIVLRKR